MANMALNIEQRLGQRLTHEQYLFWTQILTNFPTANIRPYVVINGIGNLTTYVAGRFFVAHELTMMFTNASAAQVALPYVIMYNEINVNIGVYTDGLAYWDTTAAAPRFSYKPVIIKNALFGRLVHSYSTCVFIGYEVTY